MELEAQRELVLVPRLERPGQPAHQAVNGVVALRLVEGGLGPDPVELVAAVGQAVRPRGQDLAPARMRPLVGPEAVDDRVRPRRVGASVAPTSQTMTSWRPCPIRHCWPVGEATEILGVRAVIASELKQTRASVGVRGRREGPVTGR